MGPCQSCQLLGQLPCSTPASRSELYYSTEPNNAAPSYLALASYTLSHPIRTARLARFGSCFHSRFRLYSPECPSGRRSALTFIDAETYVSVPPPRVTIAFRMEDWRYESRQRQVPRTAHALPTAEWHFSQTAHERTAVPYRPVYMHRGEASVHSTDASQDSTHAVDVGTFNYLQNFISLHIQRSASESEREKRA